MRCPMWDMRLFDAPGTRYYATLGTDVRHAAMRPAVLAWLRLCYAVWVTELGYGASRWCGTELGYGASRWCSTEL
eukprot:3828552-Rhodomonas_salina.2